MNVTSPDPKHNLFRVKMVTTPEEMLHAITIRAICFMEETGFPAKSAYDGNDYQCSHVIAYAGDEPIASCRIRWFKDFAKIERTSLRKDYRSSNALKLFGQFVFDHAAMKGYETITTSATPLLARLWRHLLGFEAVKGKPPIIRTGTDEPYLELVKTLTVPEGAITIDMPGMVLMRIEGAWDEPLEYEG